MRQKNFKGIQDIAYEIFIGGIISGIVGAIISNYYPKNPMAGMAIFIFLFLGFVIYILFVRYKRLFKLLRAGMKGFYNTFDAADNDEVLIEVNTSFRYLGISGNTIIESFRRWVGENPGIQRYEFLLMNPESKHLKEVKAFERGISAKIHWEDIDPENRQIIEEEVRTEQVRIEGAVRALKNLSPGNQRRIEIRFFDTFIPYWMYMIDDRKLFLGIFEQGKRGMNPVLVLEKKFDIATPYDIYQNTWDNLWLHSTEA